MSPDVVTRLHHELVGALQESRDDPFGRPVTVAEIYQDLVPYRRVRSALGVELNADFEHALLRLLAGEGAWVRLEPEQAREELSRELESTNPNVTLYRKFAACDVWVAPAADDEPWAESPRTETAQASPLELDVPVAASAPDVAPSARGSDERHGGAAAGSATGTRPEAETTPSGKGAGRRGTDATCAFCHAQLPDAREVQYCPFCGADQRRQPCPSCGEVLEPDWRFCIRCGTPLESRPGGPA